MQTMGAADCLKVGALHDARQPARRVRSHPRSKPKKAVKDLLDARDLCNLFSTVIEQIDKTRGEIYKGWAPQISFDRGLRDLVEWAGHSGTLSG